jgi:hypothetical protein
MRKRLFVGGFVLALAFGMARAHADTLTVPVTFPDPTVINTMNGISDDSFAQFNPALGTLTSYTLTVAGTGTSTDTIAGPPELVFKVPVTFDTILDLSQTSDTFSFSGSGSTSFSGDFAGVIGTGDAAFLLQDSSLRDSVTTLTFTTATVTYDYTPSTVTPEPAGLALLGTAVLGTAGVVRRRLFAR